MASAVAYEGVWDQEDERERNKCLARMLDPKPPLVGDPFDFPAAGAFLCLPREVLQERTYNLFQTAAMIYGLIFSGIAGSALSPFDVAEYAEGSANRTLANVYNLFAIVQFVICVSCMWEATVMSIAVCSESDLTIYRFALHTSRIGWSMVVNTGYSCLLLLAQVSVVIFMKTDTMMAYIALIVVIVLVVAKHAVFWPRFMNSSPGYVYPMFNGFPLAVILRLFGPGKQVVKKKADRLATLKAEEVAHNFGAHVLDAVRESLSGSGAERNQEATAGPPTAGPGRRGGDETDDLESEQGRLLSQFLEVALPQVPPERLKTLCVALIKADLDLHTMTMAARNPIVLDTALQDDGMRLNLRLGERLALVSSAESRREMGGLLLPARSLTSTATGRAQTHAHDHAYAPSACVNISGVAFRKVESLFDSTVTHETSPQDDKDDKDQAGAASRCGLSLSQRVGELEKRVLASVEALPLAHRISALETLCGVEVAERHKDISDMPARLSGLERIL